MQDMTMICIGLCAIGTVFITLGLAMLAYDLWKWSRKPKCNGRYAVCHGAQMQDLWRIVKAMNAIEASKIEASKESAK